MSSQIVQMAICDVQEGKGDRFLELFAEAAEWVTENEPGTVMYELSKGRDEPNGPHTTFVVRGIFDDKAALDKHMAGQGLKNLIEAQTKEGLTKSIRVVFLDNEGKIGYALR